MYLLATKLDFYRNSTSFVSGISDSIADKQPVIWQWIKEHVLSVLMWFNQPHIRTPIIIWATTFTICIVLLSFVGFNPIGIGAGTLAAAFQSWAYGGFTPAGGLFATLTSLAMLGVLAPAQAICSAIIDTVVTGIAMHNRV